MGLDGLDGRPTTGQGRTYVPPPARSNMHVHVLLGGDASNTSGAQTKKKATKHDADGHISSQPFMSSVSAQQYGKNHAAPHIVLYDI